MIRVVRPGPSRLPEPGVKKAPDTGSGSATLMTDMQDVKNHGHMTETDYSLFTVGT